MKIEFSSQRREMLLFLTTNMAAVTSRANQQYCFNSIAQNGISYGLWQKAGYNLGQNKWKT